jgi:hypothetical protein
MAEFLAEAIPHPGLYWEKRTFVEILIRSAHLRTDPGG